MQHCFFFVCFLTSPALILCILMCTDKRPDLLTLENFPHPSRYINIMQEVAPKYKHLGNILLQNPSGARVQVMERSHAHNVDDVVYDIFQKWLVEDANATWSKLVKCLKEASLNSLAQEIGTCLV